MVALFHQARQHANRIAVQEGDKIFTYAQLLHDSQRLAAELLVNCSDLAEARVAFMVNPGYDYVKALWAIWQAGGVAVPLYSQAPEASVQYSLQDTGATFMIVSSEHLSRVDTLCKTRNIELIELKEQLTHALVTLPDVTSNRRAMILYTSGTTSQPKGVVTTHENIAAQITSLVQAWQWQPQDHTICILPLHHVHGIINVVCCSLWIGARCEFVPAFSAAELFRIFSLRQINVFMAVPTIYFKLMEYWNSMSSEEQLSMKSVLAAFRLMVCGSAALPASIMEKWHAISGHRLLERYGMTEIGMALSNPYVGERKAGYVGLPLPGVQVRLCDDAHHPVSGEPGEIQVKGNTVFLEYWQRPNETAASFTADGWFCTGDVAEIDAHGYYKILGRKSQDIIKSGGYKISAIEIEEVLRQHPTIKDASVVGLPDEEWGERIAAAIVADSKLETNALTDWLRERLSKYKIPKQFIVVGDFPRNAMGKVVKNELKKLFA
jgi:malonyl-CoA/methylmalonyl-CoA synthetase